MRLEVDCKRMVVRDVLWGAFLYVGPTELPIRRREDLSGLSFRPKDRAGICVLEHRSVWDIDMSFGRLENEPFP